MIVNENMEFLSYNTFFGGKIVFWYFNWVGFYWSNNLWIFYMREIAHSPLLFIYLFLFWGSKTNYLTKIMGPCYNRDLWPRPRSSLE